MFGALPWPVCYLRQHGTAKRHTDCYSIDYGKPNSPMRRLTHNEPSVATPPPTAIGCSFISISDRFASFDLPRNCAEWWQGKSHFWAVEAGPHYSSMAVMRDQNSRSVAVKYEPGACPVPRITQARFIASVIGTQTSSPSAFLRRVCMSRAGM